MGFLYNPSRILPYAWSIASETAHISAIDPPPFDIIFVNLGQGWNVATNTYTVQAAGVYYIHITAGIYTSYPTKLELVVNGVASVNVFRQSTQHITVDTRSRAFILRLAEGDVLKLRLPGGFATFSDALRETTFSGFRLYN
jgi:hypothetical protein